MKAMNMTASIAARTFSARRASQEPTVPRRRVMKVLYGAGAISGRRRIEPTCTVSAPPRTQPADDPAASRSRASHRVDLVQHAGGPALRELGGKVLLLCELAERLHVRSVDVEPLRLE